MGKQHAACPYYTARSIVADAEIVFCPYSYLLDPYVRKRMEIELNDSIIILDEAHNIEDVAVDAASWNINFEELQVFSAKFLLNFQETSNILKELLNNGAQATIYEMIFNAIDGLRSWFIHLSNTPNLTLEGKFWRENK